MSKKRKGLLQRILMVVLIVCMLCGSGIMALADEAVASTMRLTKTEGTVSVTNKNGRDMGTMADMKLFNGYHLTTAQKSYAWMNLDDSKLIKLDAVSEAEIQKKGKDLEVLLNSGNLLFNVTENLKADETLNIRTSTMVTGIRGTCGWVKVLDASRTQVYILEGQVECYVMDPVSGQYKSVILRPGQMAEFVVYDQTRVGDKCDIIVNGFSEKNIDGFVAVELMNNSDLRDRITGAANIDINWIFNNAPTILDQDQKNVEEKFGPINEAVKQQEHTVKKDPLFGNDDDDDDDGGGGGGGSSTTPPDDDDTIEETPVVKDPVSLYMDTDDTAFLATAENLEKYLALENIFTVNVYKADDPQKNMFYVDRSMIVEARKTVNFESGINVTVDEGQTFTINGTVNVAGGDVVNNGSISNFSMNTLDVTGMIENTTTGTIDNIGRIVVTGTLDNNGSMHNEGTIEGELVLNTNAVAVLYGSKEDEQGNKGLLNIDNLTIAGGEAELVDVNLETINVDNGQLIISNGTEIGTITVSATQDGMGIVTLNGGSVTTIEADNGQVIVDSGNVGTIKTQSAGNGTGTTTAANITVNGGTVETAQIDSASLTVNGGTITTANATTQLRVTNGYIETLNTSARRAVVSGGTIQNATVTAGEVDMTNGNVGTFTVEGATVDVSGGTADRMQVTDCALTIDGTFAAGSVSSEDSNLYIGQGYTGTIGTLEINGNYVNENVDLPASSIAGGTVTDGVVVSGTDTLLEITGGTLRAENAEAALTINVTRSTGTSDGVDNVYLGTCTIDGQDKQAIVLESGVVFMSEPDSSEMTPYWPTIRANDPKNLISAAYSEDTMLLCGEEAIDADTYLNYKEVNGQAELSSTHLNLSYALSGASAGEVVLVHENDNFPVYEIVDIYEGTAEKPVVLDLNGQNLTTDTVWTIYDGAALEVRDSVGGGNLYINQIMVEESANLMIDGVELTVPDNYDISGDSCYFENYGTITYKDVNATLYKDLLNYGAMTIENGTYVGRSVCISNYGELSLTGELVFENLTDYDTEMFEAISQQGGSTTIYDSEIVCDLLDEYSYFLSVSPYENDETAEEATVIISNSRVDSGIAVAIIISDGATLTVDDNSILTSKNSSFGTIVYNHNQEDVEETILFLKDGVIENTGVSTDDSSFSAIYIYASTPTYYPANVSPFSVNLSNMVIRSKEPYPIDYYSYEGETEPYLRKFGYMISDPDESGWYSIVEYVAPTAMTLSLDSIVDSNLKEDSETSTPSNATPSNASGTPSDTAKSAIPFAVAMMAGLMAVGPKLEEMKNKNNRKER